MHVHTAGYRFRGGSVNVKLFFVIKAVGGELRAHRGGVNDFSPARLFIHTFCAAVDIDKPVPVIDTVSLGNGCGECCFAAGRPYLLVIVVRNRMAADQRFIWLFSLILFKRVFGDQHSVPDRVFTSSLCLLLRVFNVIMIGERVRKHVQMSLHRNRIGERESAHPCHQLSAVLLTHVRECVPGDLPVVVYNPVPRDLIVRFRAAVAGRDGVQKHLLMISEKAMDILISFIKFLHKTQCLHRLCAPVAVVSEKI